MQKMGLPIPSYQIAAGTGNGAIPLFSGWFFLTIAPMQDIIGVRSIKIHKPPKEVRLMLECKDIRSLLPDYAAGNLAEDTARQVEDHLLLCPICAGMLEQLRAAEYRAPLIQPAGLPRTTPPKIKQEPLAAGKDSAPKTPAAQEAAHAPEEDPAPAEVEPSANKSRLSRRSKVLLALAVPVMILGVVLALLISRDVFSIRDRAYSADKSRIAVMYQGAEKGAKDGFRIRLWTDGDWERETVFYNMEYRSMVWSPDGRFLALELLDQDGKSAVYMMDTQRRHEGGLTALLETYLHETDGLFGNAFLADVPACTILRWLPDSSALLVAGEGTLDTEVDPDYSIRFAGGSTENSNDRLVLSPNAAESTETAVYISTDITTVSGYFAYVPETGQIQNIIGFGTPAYDGEDDSTGPSETQKNMEALFKTTQAQELLGWNVITHYGQQALLLVPYLQQEGRLEVYIVNSGNESVFGTDLQALTELPNGDHVVLVTRCDGKVTPEVYKGYLLIPYEELVS